MVMTKTMYIELAPAEGASARVQTAIFMYGPYFVILDWEEDPKLPRDCIRAYSMKSGFAVNLPIDELLVVAEHEVR